MRISKDSHLLNFSRANTIKYSAMISSDTKSVPIVLAFFKAKAGGECSLNTALISVLVSNTKNLFIRFQEFLQLRLIETLSISFSSCCFHDVKQPLIS